MNTYKIIDDKDSTLEISGNKHDGTILIDTNMIGILNKYSWYIKDSTNNIHYVACKMKGKTVKLHRFIMNATDRKEIIDHIDRNTFNNRQSNLRAVNSTTNNLNSAFSKNNTSGRTGVRYSEGQGTRSAFFEAQYSIDFKKKTKRFSVNKYGYDNAFKLAVEFRENFEKENNVLTSKNVQRLSKPLYQTVVKHEVKTRE